MSKPQIHFNVDTNDWKENQLKNILSLTTGKLDANAASKDGQFAFFTCGKEQLLTKTFAFSGDAILINGNGDLGYTRKYSGFFNAYQRTYVLQNFNENFEFVEIAIKKHLPNKIKEEAIGGAMPYIKSDTISGLKIYFPTVQSQKQIVSFFVAITNKINNEQQIIDKLNKIKTSMLKLMFSEDTSMSPRLRFNEFTNPWEQ